MITVDQETKRAFRDGSTHKRWTIQVYTDDSLDFVISNSNLVSESITYDERLCSGDELQFGLCEGAEFSFQYFGLENIRGKRVRPFVSVEKFDGTWSADIPMGWFTVKECSRQASTGIIKASCYDHLGDEFLEEDQSENAKALYEGTDYVPLYNISESLTMGFMKPSQRVPMEVWREGEYGVDIKSPPLAYSSFYYEAPINRRRYALSEWDEEHGRPYTNTYLWFHTYTTRYLFHAYELDGRERIYHCPTRIEALVGSLRQIEENFVTYLTEAFKGVLTSYQDPLLHYLCREVGFQNLLGVKVVRPDHSTKLYSTIQWEYEEQYGDPHTVDGTLEDLFKMQGYPLKGNASHGQDIEYTVIIPYYISDSDYSQQGTITPIIYDENDREYEWYTGSDHTISISDFPYLQYGEHSLYGLPASEKGIALFEFPDLPNAFTKEVPVEEMPDFTLREILTAAYETACEFGVLDRVTDQFSGVTLKTSVLYPAETLYPSNYLLPSEGGGSERVDAGMYEKLWADEGNIRTFRNLIITYKTMVPDEEYPDDRTKDKEGELTIEKTVNENGTDDYIVDDNWLFKSFIWDAEDVESYADEMVRRMANLRWFPFELWCAGLPYLETGDMVEIHMGENAYRSYVLRRNLKGLQNIHDEYINGSLDIF